MRTIVCSNNTVRESSHISFFCGRDRYCEVVQRPEKTRDELTGLLERPAVSPHAWETSRPLPFAWATTGSLPSVQIYRPYIVFSVQIYRPYIVFSSPMLKYEHPLCFTYFSVCGWLSELTYFRVFFPVICWSYLRTDISVTQSIGNKSYSLSCETTLLVLSCDHIESKFIVTS